MKRILIVAGVLAIAGCTQAPVAEQQVEAGTECIGSTDLPDDMKGRFERVDDEPLLNQALGEPDKGGLCQGQVYLSKTEVEIPLYRAWNSTNPNSRLGNWWAFDMPAGKVATYRTDYEICYQWSPLDKLETCTLKPGTRVVVGTGQSAQCSQYLSYPVSKAQQIFIDDAAEALADCRSYDGEFSWK